MSEEGSDNLLSGNGSSNESSEDAEGAIYDTDEDDRSSSHLGDNNVIAPYQFEPLASENDSDRAESSSGTDDERLGDISWKVSGLLGYRFALMR